jgi:hypothetical protein
MNKQETLTIEFVQYIDGHLWLDLTTDTETRQCCYTFDADNNCWVWETGDGEPAMSAELFSKWENGRGDELINACLETEEKQTLTA